MTRLTADFDLNEFRCPCCGQADINRDSVGRLQRLRSKYGKPIRIVEGGGYRCELYLNGSKSAHGEGKAFDLGVPREDLYRVLKLAFEVGFTGIGFKNKDGKWQLHVDDAKSIPGVRPRPRTWTY